MGKFGTMALAGAIVASSFDSVDADAKPADYLVASDRIHGFGAIDTGGPHGSKVSNMPSLGAYGSLEFPSTSGRAFPYFGKHVERRGGGTHKVAEGKDENGLMEFVEKVVKFVKAKVVVIQECANVQR